MEINNEFFLPIQSSSSNGSRTVSFANGDEDDLFESFKTCASFIADGKERYII